jgi:hypothetical protein
MMLEELQRRNYAQTPISSYIRIVEDFSRRFQRAPNRLGPNASRNRIRTNLFRQNIRQTDHLFVEFIFCDQRFTFGIKLLHGKAHRKG